MAVLGLDIGADTIKVVEVAKSRGGFQLLNYGIAPTPPESVANGDVQDPEILGEAIRQLLANRRIKTRTVVSSVQGQQSLVVRIIDLPRCDPRELAETMKFEVERHIPFPASQIIMDYTVIERPGESPDSPNMEVLFAAVQEESINIHVEALRQAKLKPRAIDVQPLSLCRALVICADDGAGLGETVALVNIGAGCTDLSIVRDGVLHFPRTIPIGGRSITQRLSEGLGISEQQAERLKRQFATMRGRPAPPPEPEVEEEAEVEEEGEGLEFGGAMFEMDTQEDSDVGFGGTGLGGGADDQALDFSDAPEVHVEDDDGRSPFELPDDLSDSGPTFDFDSDDNSGTSFTLTADDDGDEGAVPDDDGDAVFQFDFSDPGSESEDEPEPEFELSAPTEDSDTGEGFMFEVPTDDAAEEAGESAGLELEPPTSETGDDAGFSFELPTDDTTDAAPASGEATEEASFDFALGEDEEASSLPDERGSSEGSATDVGSSFDLGDLGSDDGLDTGFGVLEATAEGATEADEGEPTFDIADLGGLEPTPAVSLPEGPIDDDQARVREVIEPVVREIAGEIARSLEYYRSRYEGAVVDRIVLVGGTARIDGLADFFEEELGLTVDVGDPLAPLVVNNPKLSDEDLQRDAPLLAVALGLALRELT